MTAGAYEIIEIIVASSLGISLSLILLSAGGVVLLNAIKIMKEIADGL